MKKTMAVSGFLAWLISAFFGNAVELPSWQPYDKLTGALVTSHIPFANPYYKGKVKALVIAPTWTQRETVELSQRLALEYTPLMTESYDFFGNARYLSISRKEFEEIVGKKLGPDASYDLIIIGKTSWKAFPEPVQKMILEKVQAGTGLLYINPKDLAGELKNVLKYDEPVRNAITRGVPVDRLPLLKGKTGKDFILSGNIGQGRVLAIDYGDKDFKGMGKLESLTPFGGDDPLFYDYYHSLLAKACLWAGRKEPDAFFKDFPAEITGISREKMSGDKLSFAVEGKTTDLKSINFVVRDRNNNVEFEKTVPYGNTNVSFPLPLLKNGEKILDVRLEDKSDNTVNWASCFLSVVAPLRIEGIKLDKDIHPRGEEIKGRLSFTGEISKTSRLTLEVRDGFQRRIVALTPAVKAGETDFSFPVRYPLTYAYTLTAKLEDKTGVLDEKQAPFHINITDFSSLVKDYSFIIWGEASDNSRSVRTYLQQFYNSGVDIVYVSSAVWDNYEQAREIALRLARANLMSAPYATRILMASDNHEHLKPVAGKDGLEIRNCPLSLASRKDGHLQDVARAYGPLGPSYYTLGDENALVYPGSYDVCFCKNCQENFRVYLKNIYQNIDALNNSWNSEYKDWQEVKPITLKDAYKQNRYPQWIDFRLFMDKIFGDFHISGVESIKEIDPKAQVGLEGAVYPTLSSSGFNWYQLLPHFGFFGPYFGTIDVHAALSFLPSEAIITTWFGSYEGYTDEDWQRLPWAFLFEGMNAVAWWTGGVGDSTGLGGPAAFTPDYLPLQGFQKASREIQEIKSGIGKLLNSSERKIHPIGLYYSNPCLHASTIRSRETTWKNSLLDFNCVLKDDCYEYRYLSPDDILAGKLADIRVLIFPYAQAISLPEAEKIKSFVRAGGVVIADFVPGIMDEHGKMLDKSSLADVFGEFTPMHIQPYGKGSAVYLNDYVKGYTGKIKRGEGKGIRAGLARILKDLGKLQPFAEVENADGEIMRGEVSLFEHGKARYLTLGGKESSVVKVKLPETSFIYDVRGKRFLGRADRFTTNLIYQENVFALLPAKLERMDINMDNKKYRPGEEVNFNISLPAEFKGTGLCLRVEVFGPDGKNLPYYTQKIITDNALAQGAIPLSLDDVSGNYRITVTDIATGFSITQTFLCRK